MANFSTTGTTSDTNVTFRRESLIYGAQYPDTTSNTVFVRQTKTQSKTGLTTSNFRALRKLGARLKPLAYAISQSSTMGFADGFASDLGSSISYQAGAIIGWGPGYAYPIYGPPVAVLFQSKKSYWYHTSNLMLAPSMDPFVTSATNLAINKLRLKLKDQKVNMVQAYAESDQTMRLIGDTTKKLALTFQHLRKGQLMAAGSVLGLRVGKREAARYSTMAKKAKDRASVENLMSSGVLAVQYGIKPLISDVVGAAELYAQKTVHEVVNTATVRHSVRTEQVQSGKTNSSYNAYMPYTANASATTVVAVDVKIGCTFAKGNEVLHTLSQLGLTNPLLIAWELVPWSFVIDWFIPVGNYISSLDATLGLDFKDGYVSTKSEMTHIRRQSVVGGVRANTSSSYHQKTFKRTVLTSFPSSKLPEFKNPLSWQHALNGVALLVGVKNKIISERFH